MNTQNQKTGTEDINQEDLKNTTGGGLLGGSDNSSTSILGGVGLGVSNSTTDEDGNSSMTDLGLGIDDVLNTSSND